MKVSASLPVLPFLLSLLTLPMFSLSKFRPKILIVSSLALDLKKLTRPCCFSDSHKCLNHVPATVRFCGVLENFVEACALPLSPGSMAYERSIMKGIIFQCEVMNIIPVRCSSHRTFATAGPQCSCHTHLDQPEQWSVQPQHSRRSHSIPNIMDNC